MMNTLSWEVGQDVVAAGYPTSILPYNGAVLFEAFLYGIYTILFFISIYVLVWCSPSRQWLLLATSIGMYAIATADIIYTIWLLFKTLLGEEVPQFQSLYPKYNFLVSISFVSHALLLYRCIVLWGRNWWLIGMGSFALVSVTLVGYALEGMSLKYVDRGWIWLSLMLVLNLTLTGLSAGRVFYVTKRNTELLPRPLKRRYIVTIAILVECGIIETIYLVLNLAFHKHQNVATVIDCSMVQMFGIVPTLIVAQVGLGRSASYDYSKEDPTWLLKAQRRSESPDMLIAQNQLSQSLSYTVYPP